MLANLKSQLEVFNGVKLTKGKELRERPMSYEPQALRPKRSPSNSREKMLLGAESCQINASISSVEHDPLN